MSEIKLFNDFVNEAIQLPRPKEVIKTQPDDTVTQASDKNFFNEEEELILKFNAWKADLRNIFKSSFNKKDLINRLFNKKFIYQKSEDPKKVKFFNHYLGKWAKICDKERKIDDLEEITTGNKKDAIQYDTAIKANKGNQDVANYTKDKADVTKKRIKDNLNKIKEETAEINKLNSELKKDLDVMKKKHQIVKNRIQKDEASKRSNPANTGEEQKEEIVKQK